MRCSRIVASRARARRAKDRPRRSPRSRQQSSGKAKGSGKTNDPNASQQTNGKGKPGGNSSREVPSPAHRGASPDPPRAASKASRDRRKISPATRAKARSVGRTGRAIKPSARMAAPRTRPSAGRIRGGLRAKSRRQGSQEDEEKNRLRESRLERLGKPAAPNSHRSSLPSLEWLKGPIMVGRDPHPALLASSLWWSLSRGSPRVDRGAAWLASGWPARGRRTRTMTPRRQKAPPPRPFASFVNPFDAGLDHQFSPNDLVIYSFEALEAWAYEHEPGAIAPRDTVEFVQRSDRCAAELDREATRLVGFFVTIVYGRSRLQGRRSCRRIRQFWRVLQA